ncbi:uncharacterized protein EV422DRAFT_557759 [Fimicolochytrium jonesii]|uniref:uncharacterized protein n=1 Tax=Fimicolochytrium jonesii TaxID=1396493 RepID=UPI0022FE6F21|nr:uncharacterized protein EV422DRAFT_557759 [Fimicolochytrium jonesii]KAI8820523.1 hypothetical protein EV422DRAFT_557759 [Fimicolochytrium jonesii]
MAAVGEHELEQKQSKTAPTETAPDINFPWPTLPAPVQSLIDRITSLPLLNPPHLATWSTESVLQGLHLAYEGSAFTLRAPRARSVLFRAFFYLVFATLILVTITHAAFLPLRIIHWFAHILIRPIVGERLVGWLNWVVDTFDAVMRWFVRVTPDAGMYLIRYIYPEPLDRVFFETLRGLTLTMAIPNGKARFALRFARTMDEKEDRKISTSSADLRSYSQATLGIIGGRKKWTLRLLAYLRRYAQRLMLLGALYIISLIPVVGLLIWPGATFFYLGMAIGWRRAAYTCAVGVISPPWWRFVKGPLLRGIWGFRSLERELIEPYLCRSSMGHAQRRAWFNRNEALIAGFTLPFWYLVSIPWIGPMAFGIAQGAAARLCVDIFDQVDVDSLREKHRKMGMTPPAPAVGAAGERPGTGDKADGSAQAQPGLETHSSVAEKRG